MINTNKNYYGKINKQRATISKVSKLLQEESGPKQTTDDTSPVTKTIAQSIGATVKAEMGNFLPKVSHLFL